MPGLPAIIMPFWQLLLITWQKKETAVLYDTCLLTLIDHSLDELLIDFRELIGPHSGENMASVVWSTLEFYGIEDKVGQTLLAWLRHLYVWIPNSGSSFEWRLSHWIANLSDQQYCVHFTEWYYSHSGKAFIFSILQTPLDTGNMICILCGESYFLHRMWQPSFSQGPTQSTQGTSSTTPTIPA